MCGIVGVLRTEAPVAQATVEHMTQAVSHRGPDGDGTFVEGRVGLGHRRLSIIDTSMAGAQPMRSLDGRHVITYNGEVYNFRELRAVLEGRGHRFASRTDTEVVLAAFREWGPASVARLNGMFALAIWDRERESLFLARDRFGVKPLYYALTDGALLFASEQKALLASGMLAPRVDVHGLVEYFTFQNFLTDRTLLEGVRLFPSGAHALIDPRRSVEPRPVRYWDFDFQEPVAAAPEAEYIEELDRLFRVAVERQLVSDVPVGAYLSGGMDSGSITAVAARSLPHLSTFTCGFDLAGAAAEEQSFDERSSARLMARAFETDQHEAVLTATDMQAAMKPIAWHLEEPRVGQSYPNYFAARLARASVKVVLSGTGGDELFGGYPWRYRPLLGASVGHGVTRYFHFWERLLGRAARREVFRPVAAAADEVEPRDIFDAVFPALPGDAAAAERINAALTFEARTFLQGLLLVDDKLGMAHGLETRVPFLDNDLVDFAMHVPARLKVGLNAEGTALADENDGGRTAAGKMVLRRMLGRYVRESISQRDKQGFSGPDASWFRGPCRDWLLRLLFAPESRLPQYMDPAALRPLVCEHLDGRTNRRLLVWSLLNVEQWLRLYA